MKNKNYILFGSLSLALFAGACVPPDSTEVKTNNNAADSNRAAETAGKPVIEAAPIEAGEGNYKIITGDDFKLTVRASDAREVELFYQPVTAADRALRLKTLTAPAENSKDNFVADLEIPEDFNGEVWARVKYKNGETKETDRLLLAKRGESENATGGEQANSNTNNAANSNTANSNADTEESVRSDKLTGGRIERAALKAGDGNVKITVNVPAFTMTLWQSGREIESYYVGVGLKDFPIPIGMRDADKIILNPAWIPPDSEWVRQSSDVEPYERIPADDPLNPLGKIKIPLGDAYLLHEAQSPSDVGNLVSHGCVRVLRDDIFDLTKKIVEARNLDVSKQELEAARKNSERRVINLDGEIPVDINYDTMVVEKGVLSIYPDVYERKTNTIENLRAELANYGVDVSKIDEKTLEAMLDKVSDDEKFVVALADIKAGNALGKGETKPLTPQQAK
ncbi:MAG: L,D-transpeptidase [Acidobacteriota bacterium]|nr:L,D-transpeptidase [Acidobacteriota bacterium]